MPANSQACCLVSQSGFQFSRALWDANPAECLQATFQRTWLLFPKLDFPFQKSQRCCQKASFTLLLQGYLIIFSFPLPRCHFQTIFQTSSKWLFGTKICSRVFCRFLLGIALSIHYELHTRKEGADRKGVTLRGFATFLGNFSDLMKLHELQMKNFHSTEYLDVSNTMPSDMTYAVKMRKSAEKELQNGKSNILGCLQTSSFIIWQVISPTWLLLFYCLLG